MAPSCRGPPDATFLPVLWEGDRPVGHDDPDWVRALVTRLTDRHEQQRDEPWQVTDAPEDYVTKNQLLVQP